MASNEVINEILSRVKKYFIKLSIKLGLIIAGIGLCSAFLASWLILVLRLFIPISNFLVNVIPYLVYAIVCGILLIDTKRKIDKMLKELFNQDRQLDRHMS